MVRDEDRIFTNIYGFHGADLEAAKSRGDWDNTADFIKKGRDWVIDEVKNYADRWFEIQKNLKTYSNKRNNRDSFYEKRTKH